MSNSTIFSTNKSMFHIPFAIVIIMIRINKSILAVAIFLFKSSDSVIVIYLINKGFI